MRAALSIAILTAFAATLLVALLPASEADQSLEAQGKAGASEAERKKSKNPPKGAPWTKSFEEAHKRALLSGKPIFVYSTKTY